MIDDEREILSAIALTRISGVGCPTARILHDAVGSCRGIMDNAAHLRDLVPDINPRIAESFVREHDEAMARAEAEMEFACAGHIECLTIDNERYPLRLRECDDAPMVLYYRGTADLNATRVVSVVGTRHCTEYGKDICRQLTHDFAEMCPDILVVSGLAYGIDVNAHRGCLQAGLSTVGVLAHGLDQIYPARHRATAIEMLANGGLLTEYVSGSFPDRGCFVQRNRIVAGMADACVVVESADKGGSLITARLASDYNRDVFAFPGRLTDQYSLGCNRLINQNKAQLAQSAYDILMEMGWGGERQRKQPVQRELFPADLSPEESAVVSALMGSDGKQINHLSVELSMPVSRLSSLLFTLEMKGHVKAMVGGVYRLLS